MGCFLKSMSVWLLICMMCLCSQRVMAQDNAFDDGFWKDEGWQGGTTFISLLDAPAYDLKLNDLQRGDVAIIVAPDKTMFSNVSLESFALRGIRVIVFDEGVIQGEKVELAHGADRLVAHINGNPDLPVVEANVTFPWSDKPWKGKIAMNHPSPVAGVEAMVGSDAFGYVWTPGDAIWIVRDASLVTNFMIPMYDNESFIRALVACEEAPCRQVVYAPRRVIERGTAASSQEKAIDLMDRMRQFFNDQREVFSSFPWLKLMMGIIVFWLSVTAWIAFPRLKDV